VVLLGLYSYFMTVQLRPNELTIHEILVWVWALTLWLEEIRQVVLQVQFSISCMIVNHHHHHQRCMVVDRCVPLWPLVSSDIRRISDVTSVSSQIWDTKYIVDDHKIASSFCRTSRQHASGLVRSVRLCWPVSQRGD